MSIDIERLKTDAAYWDECEAPEDATHYVDKTFTKWVNGVEFDYWEDAKEWRRAETQYALERYMEESDDWVIIPRPTTQSQEWDGEGYPPVGRECERFSIENGQWHGPAKVFHITKLGVCFVEYDHGGWDKSTNPTDFRPLRTKEQRQRDELIKIINEADEMAYSFRPDDLADAILSKYLSKYNLTEK